MKVSDLHTESLNIYGVSLSSDNQCITRLWSANHKSIAGLQITSSTIESNTSSGA